MGQELNDWAGTILQPTGHICADCEENIVYTEEAVLVQIIQPQLIGGQVFYHPVINEQDRSGDFEFEPYFFCFDCWEKTYEELREELEDTPPLVDESSAFECICCSSGIREWEYAGTFTLGEFHVSRRAPNGVHGPRFEPNGKPELLCLYCLTLINEGYIEMWDELSQFGECSDCIGIRCWRYGQCACGCHQPFGDENNE